MSSPATTPYQPPTPKTPADPTPPRNDQGEFKDDGKVNK